MAIGSEQTVRRELRDGDAAAIVELHRRVYGGEYERNEAFVAAVAENVVAQCAAGWPQESGGVWLVELDGTLEGCLGLTDEHDGSGHVRWFVFAPALRGSGLGRQLLFELLAEARAAGMHRLEFETFSDLRAAAHLYRDAGFEVISEVRRDDWGPTITYQHYRLDLNTI
jgi:ribosomal protein S18 acetylase RimI-like enzyme